MLPKANVKAEFVGHDAEDRQSKTCQIIKWGCFSWTRAQLLVIWEALLWSCQGFVRTVQQRMRRESAKLPLLRLSLLYRTEISENETTAKASHRFTWVSLCYKKPVKWWNLSEHYIWKNQLFGCCRHMRWTSVFSACTQAPYLTSGSHIL